MGLVLFAWLTAQSFFKDSTNIDIRQFMLAEQNLLGEEELVPVGIFDDGRKEEVTVAGEDIWSTRDYLNERL